MPKPNTNGITLKIILLNKLLELVSRPITTDHTPKHRTNQNNISPTPILLPHIDQNGSLQLTVDAQFLT